MSRARKIWNNINCRGGRKTPVNFGANDGFSQDIFIGSGPNNSHKFASISVECIDRNEYWEYVLFVNGHVIKRVHMDKKRSGTPNNITNIQYS